MARAMGLWAWLLVAVATTMIACAGEPPDPVPADPTTPAAMTAVPQANRVATDTVELTPTATAQLVLTAAVAMTPLPAMNTPARPASTRSLVSPPAGTGSQAAAPERFLIRLKDDLDDPLGYCIDVRGFGAGIRLDADLQAHSCKSSAADDQSFAMMGEPRQSSILLVDYDICLAVAEPETGASILLSPCGDSSVYRRFEWLPDGRLQLLAEQTVSQPMLCVGVAGGAGEPAGGRNHLRRDLMLYDCENATPALTTWKMAESR